MVLRGHQHLAVFLLSLVIVVAVCLCEVKRAGWLFCIDLHMKGAGPNALLSRGDGRAVTAILQFRDDLASEFDERLCR